jgi:hypothetical protein
MIFKIFSPEKLAKKLELFVQNTADVRKIYIATLFVKINAIFPPKFGKNRRKLRS